MVGSTLRWGFPAWRCNTIAAGAPAIRSGAPVAPTSAETAVRRRDPLPPAQLPQCPQFATMLDRAVIADGKLDGFPSLCRTRISGIVSFISLTTAGQDCVPSFYLITLVPGTVGTHRKKQTPRANELESKRELSMNFYAIP
jgi:hypothetical protein